jgi:DNA-binding CsgD family transcriptional regulator
MRSAKVNPIDTQTFSQYWLQYKAESSLPDPQVVFKNLISSIHHYALGIFYWNIGCVPETKIVAAGGALKQLTGFSKDHWLGVSPAFAFQHFYEADIPFLMAYVMKFDEYMTRLDFGKRANVKASIYGRIKTVDNKLKWGCIQYPGFYYNEAGNIVYVLTVCSDISHIKRDSNPPFMSILDMNMDDQQIFLCHGANELLQRQITFPLLTQREREIVSFLAKGKSSKQIADELQISKSTIDNFRQKLLKKLNVSSSGEMISTAIENGLI